ncbi:hypothetical protein BSPWISOXPB_6385 [uncultured Gammaproteobacteria bacterium]|nr:hypothetical protein BSPWISOXPB_6385 [uncultured Gammaproteobacteria bacterium]
MMLLPTYLILQALVMFIVYTKPWRWIQVVNWQDLVEQVISASGAEQNDALTQMIYHWTGLKILTLTAEQQIECMVM